MKVVSLYAGADNLGDGVWQAGHEIILAVEYYPKDPKLSQDACETIRLNHPDTEVIHKPVSEILSTLPKCDAIIGGPPCPEFSNAKLVKDVEAGLCEVNNFVKAREITKAKYYLMENVEGLYKHHKQRNFLINCADYGVPQTRIRRIFTNLELPMPTHAEHPTERLFGEPLKKWVSVREALNLGDGMIEDRKTKPSMEPEFRKYNIDKPSHTLLSDPRDWFILDKTQVKWKEKLPIKSIDKPSSTILTDSKDMGLHFISSTGFSKSNRENKSRSVDEPSDTIVVANSMVLTPDPIKSKKKVRNRFDQLSNSTVQRRLSNEELAILQGFRPDFKFFGTKSSIKRQIGNAVPAVIGKRFFEGVKI